MKLQGSCLILGLQTQDLYFKGILWMKHYYSQKNEWTKRLLISVMLIILGSELTLRKRLRSGKSKACATCERMSRVSSLWCTASSCSASLLWSGVQRSAITWRECNDSTRNYTHTHTHGLFWICHLFKNTVFHHHHHYYSVLLIFSHISKAPPPKGSSSTFKKKKVPALQQELKKIITQPWFQ